MHLNHYQTSQNLPALAIYLGDPASGHDVKFESQPDGFGMEWETPLGITDALNATRPLIEPDPETYARVVRFVIKNEHEFGNKSKELPLDELDDELAIKPGEIQIVRYEIGAAAVYWARANGEGNSKVKDKTPDPAMIRALGYGDDFYQKTKVEALLRTTGSDLIKSNLDAILDAADITLQAHKIA